MEGGKEWKQYFPDIIKTKFDDYLQDYEKLSLVLKDEQNIRHDKMNEGSLVIVQCWNVCQNSVVKIGFLIFNLNIQFFQYDKKSD